MISKFLSFFDLKKKIPVDSNKNLSEIDQEEAEEDKIIIQQYEEAEEEFKKYNIIKNENKPMEESHLGKQWYILDEKKKKLNWKGDHFSKIVNIKNISKFDKDKDKIFKKLLDVKSSVGQLGQPPRILSQQAFENDDDETAFVDGDKTKGTKIFLHQTILEKKPPEGGSSKRQRKNTKKTIRKMRKKMKKNKPSKKHARK
jgi:hypothetical protein